MAASKVSHLTPTHTRSCVGYRVDFPTLGLTFRPA